MATEKEASQNVEWRAMASNGSTLSLEKDPMANRRTFSRLHCWISSVQLQLPILLQMVRKICSDDPRRVIHCIKVGLALSLVSIFYYTRPLYEGVGGTAMWSIMTVVVVFEFTVGGSLYKGLNRAMATLSAGTLAVGIHWLATKSGKTGDHIILGTSVFLLSAAATFSRFIPTIKARFDYGITIFILTFCLVAVSGYRVESLLTLAQRRACTVLIGIGICLVVCIVVCPVWAGDELRCLIAGNLEKLAESLEGGLPEKLLEEDTPENKHKCSKRLQGNKSILNSKAPEDSLANLALWEPTHGHFSFRHPWRQYQKVGAAMRYCASCIEALNDCIPSIREQSPENLTKQFGEVFKNLNLESAKVVKELANSVRCMKRSSTMENLLGEMCSAAEELQNAIGALTQAVPIMEAMPLMTMATLLLEITTRVEAVADAVEDLATLASFKPMDGQDEEEKEEKLKQAEATKQSSSSKKEEEARKVLQLV